MPDTLDLRDKAVPQPDAQPHEAVETPPPRGCAGKCDIDHASLTRQIIARFPKILAALAK